MSRNEMLEAKLTKVERAQARRSGQTLTERSTSKVRVRQSQ